MAHLDDEEAKAFRALLIGQIVAAVHVPRAVVAAGMELLADLLPRLARRGSLHSENDVTQTPKTPSPLVENRLKSLHSDVRSKTDSNGLEAP